MKKCMQCGGATKKMQKGGSQKIVGMPGYNATTRPMQMKNGGIKKMQPGGSMKGELAPKSVNQRVLTKSQTPSDFNKVVGEGTFVKRGGAIKSSYKKGGATKFGMLSVKAGIDNNPKATAADRIAGAKKRSSKKK